MTCSNCKRENVFLMSEDNLCTRCYAPCRFRQFPHDGRLLDDPQDPTFEIRRYFQRGYRLDAATYEIHARCADVTANTLSGQDAQNFQEYAAACRAYINFIQTCTPATWEVMQKIEAEKRVVYQRLQIHHDNSLRRIGGIIVETPEMRKILSELRPVAAKLDAEKKQHIALAPPSVDSHYGPAHLRPQIVSLRDHVPQHSSGAMFRMQPPMHHHPAGAMLGSSVTRHPEPVGALTMSTVPRSAVPSMVPASAAPTSLSSFLVSRMHFPHSAQMPQSQLPQLSAQSEFPYLSMQHAHSGNCAKCEKPLNDPSSPSQSIFTNLCGHLFHPKCIHMHLAEVAAPRGGMEALLHTKELHTEVLPTVATCPVPNCGAEIISIRDPRAQARPFVKQPAPESRPPAIDRPPSANDEW